MVLIAKQQLDRVRTQRQIDRRFCLSGTEVQMIEVIRDGFVQWRQLGINQEMMVAGIGLFDACRRNAHIDQTEANGRLLRQKQIILHLQKNSSCRISGCTIWNRFW